jgi:hypothetical protein
MKGIPLELAQHIIELDTSIPLACQAKVYVQPQLCYSCQTRYWQIISSKIHSTSRGGYMVITYNGSTKIEWKTENLCRF